MQVDARYARVMKEMVWNDDAKPDIPSFEAEETLLFHLDSHSFTNSFDFCLPSHVCVHVLVIHSSDQDIYKIRAWAPKRQ
jgi:hypothetical protein